MRGKIPLVKGFHVIFTNFHDCVAHYVPTVPTEIPRTTTGMPVSPSVALIVYFHGYLQFCVYATEKLSDGHSYFTVE